MTMTYRGFKCQLVGPSRWRITFPSGITAIFRADSESQVKQKIDDLVSF